jgi:alkylation response protein AidB-like acyl-CoA dehydrogenase
MAFAAESTTLGAVGYLESINRIRATGPVPATAFDEAGLATSKAQVSVSGTVLQAATLLFETGGASAVCAERQLDRHWRNARVLTVHNPVIYKERVVGESLLHDDPPTHHWTVGVNG